MQTGSKNEFFEAGLEEKWRTKVKDELTIISIHPFPAIYLALLFNIV